LAIVVAAVAVSAFTELEYQGQFTNWMTSFDKQYEHAEFFSRYNTFKSWVDFVAAHNAANATWKAGLNQFSDLTPTEFAAKHLNGLAATAMDLVSDPASDEAAPVANDINWITKGAVTPVKNQGSCGSCWAFSAIGMVEGWSAVKTGKLTNLAEQQLVDCAGSFGNQGCNGGWHDKAVDYLASTQLGSCVQADYPYTARTGTCKTTCKGVIKPNKSQMGTTEQALMTALGNAPVGVAVDASGGFQSYHSGVFNGPCGQNLNHAILAVGYVSAPGYWIVKNSWGTTWGAAGYINIATGKNLCGINKHTAWVTF